MVSLSSGLLGFFLTLSTVKLKSLVAPGQCAAWLLLAQVREAGGSVLGWTQCSQSWHCQVYLHGVRSRHQPSPDPHSGPCLRFLLVLPAGALGSPLTLLSPDSPSEHERFYKQTNSILKASPVPRDWPLDARGVLTPSWAVSVQNPTGQEVSLRGGGGR